MKGLLLLLLLLPRSADTQPHPGHERLTYTITYLGIAVARVVTDQVPPAESGGEWLVRTASRSTRFWDTFFHIRNTYTTRFDMPDFQPSVYERRIDQGRLRFRSLDRYGSDATDRVEWMGLPPLPERYAPRGEPERVDQQQVDSRQGNIFSALWWVRFADWERLGEATRRLYVDGVRWRVHIRKEGTEERRSYEGRLPVWKLIITFERLDPEGTDEEEAERRDRTDYLTRELVRESVTITFWLERAPARRPVELVVRRPRMRVRAVLREPFDSERYFGPGG